VNEIVLDKDLIEKFKSLNKDKKIMDKSVEAFKKELFNIIDNFEKGHENLKGGCCRCRNWHK